MRRPIMKNMLFTTAAVVMALSQNAQSYWFDTPTYESITAQERANRVMDLPEMREGAEESIIQYIDNPAHKRYLETETRSHEVMGEAEIASHLIVSELLDGQIKNPIVEMNFPHEKAINGKIVRETMKVNLARFGKSDVNNVFTDQELTRIERELMQRAEQPALLSEYKEDFNALFFDWRLS